MRVRLYKKTKDNLSYFQFLSDDGQAVLNSQGYTDKDDRNNGVRAVVANANNAARYERQTTADGKRFFIIKAGNGQEIAHSVDFDDAAAMEAAIAACIAEVPSITADEGEGQPREAAAVAADNNPYDDGIGGDDNYRPLAFYQERIKGVENGFDGFATDAGQFYFTLNQGGKIVLISEAYTSTDGRNNGSESVSRNLPNPDRYQPKQHPNGKYYFNLLAGNNQQIATSIWFDTVAERDAAMNALQRGQFGGTEEVVLKTAGSGVAGEIEGMAFYRATVKVADAPPPKEKKEKKKRKPKEHKEKSAEEKVFLKSGNYLFNGVTWQTMRSANHKHYFSFRTAEGKSLMLSTNVQGFATEAEVDAQVQKVLDLGPYEGNYQGKTTTNKKYYFYLNDTEGKPVAKSFFYDSTADMNDAIGLLIGRAKVAAAAAPTAIATTEGIHDDYLACERYNGPAGASDPAFHRFFNGDDENWYFGYNDANGKTLLRSEGYTTEKARDNGIESVIKNSPLEERWVTGMDGDQYYYALRAGNNQEIARSCYFADEESMNAGLAAAKDAFAPKVEKAAEPAPRIVDDYLPCEAYAGMEGYHKFEHEGEYYFSYNDIAGNVILRSEGYKSEAARDNGIESVKKNSTIEDHWIKKQHEDGRWYFSLIAGNRQEIARTCYHDEAALFGILRSAVGPLYTPPPPPKAPEPAPRIVDDYLPCEAYAGMEGYHKFEHEGEYYFSYNDIAGNVILRSEGYKSAGARDNGIESVKKNSTIEDHWIKKQHEDGRWYFSLIAGNKQEIARTCYHDEAALFGILRSAVGPLYTPPPPPKAPEPVAAPAPVIMDDYLPCEAYAGNADDDGFRRFLHEGEYYFAYLDNDGDVVLRSEAYKSAGARDNGIASVKKNAPIEERWVKEKTDDGREYWSLKAANRQEIARSCYKDSVGAAGWGLFGLAAAAAAVAAVPMEAVMAAPAPPPPVPVPAPVVEKPKAVVPPPPPPAPVAAPVAAATSGGSNWWKWLLPLLLLALLFFLWKGCDGCNKTAPPPAPVEEPATQVTPPADTVKEEPAPPAEPAAPVCACTGSENPIFNIPSGATPKQLSRLGTNPEFGNSHGLDGKGFFDKLTRNYKRSTVDKTFLDGVFKAMGYANGFADAKPELFSEVILPEGTTGNIGYSKLHKTLYATIPTTEKDRMAFRIESANGCTMHFMKTCGNHFFFCPK